MLAVFVTQTVFWGQSRVLLQHQTVSDAALLKTHQLNVFYWFQPYTAPALCLYHQGEMTVYTSSTFVKNNYEIYTDFTCADQFNFDVKSLLYLEELCQG